MRAHDANTVKVRERLFQQIRDLEALRVEKTTIPHVQPPQELMAHVASSVSLAAQSAASSVSALGASLAPARASAAGASTPPASASAAVGGSTSAAASVSSWHVLRERFTPASVRANVTAFGATMRASWSNSVPSAMTARHATVSAVAGAPAALMAGAGALRASFQALPTALSGEVATVAAGATRFVRYKEGEEARYEAEKRVRDAKLTELDKRYARTLAIIQASVVSYLTEGVLVKDAIFICEDPYHIKTEILDEEHRVDMSKLTDEEWQAEHTLIKDTLTHAGGVKYDLLHYLTRFVSSRPVAHRRAAAVTTTVATTPSPAVAAEAPAVEGSVSAAVYPASAAQAVTLDASSVPATRSSPLPASAIRSNSAVLFSPRNDLSTRVHKMIVELSNELHIPWLFDTRRAVKKRFLLELSTILNSGEEERVLKARLKSFIDGQLNSIYGSLILAGVFSTRTACLIADLRAWFNTTSALESCPPRSREKPHW